MVVASAAPSEELKLAPESVRTGLSADAIRQSVLDNLALLQARFPEIATPWNWYMALGYSVRDRLLARWIASVKAYAAPDVKVACYLSAEFLIGPQLASNLLNLGIGDEVREAMHALDQDLDALIALEAEPGLGNGGLGRLAACFLDSLATLEVPAIGYGIRYEFGIFEQGIRDGWQVERTDKWLQRGTPWEVMRPEVAYTVNFNGYTTADDSAGQHRVRWVPGRQVRGVACDIPVPGYRVETCNTLRLWKSEAVESFDLEDFQVGDYYGAVAEKVTSETLSKVLYPNDEPEIGKRLRLAQQYFFTSCSLQDMLRQLEMKGQPVTRFADLCAVQLNDTHPSIAVAELMRLLVDEHGLPWDDAWDITRRALAYTNHTLLPEALETWDLALFRDLLPRPLEIIFEINRRFLDEVRRRHPGDAERVRRMSLIDEAGGRRVRMAHLATVGSHAINGVSALHSELLRRTVLCDFAGMWPERFSNVTNGVTPRRFLLLANPPLAGLLDEAVGDGWATDPRRLQGLERLAGDSAFQARWRAARQWSKERLAGRIREATGAAADPAALFDVQVKRIHEYKRQHLNVLHIITLYQRLLRNPGLDIAPRCFVFAGKAAPGYRMAKLIIRLINGVADVINNDPAVRGRLLVAFLPNFNVSSAQHIYPAADLSEQISTAGKEAAGTGNMKFMMNGALTIGTLDGANVEIRDAAGHDNFFLFGLDAAGTAALRAGGYRPREWYERDAELRGALDALGDGSFARGDTTLFRPLLDHLLAQDDYLLLADYRAYLDAQAAVDQAFHDRSRWTRMSILNTARSGYFSSDRAIREYCSGIWNVRRMPAAGKAKPATPA
ncbi:MAG: glycogen/starch/alpha-glucan phosphorylase [Gammaproteobacteria bacterium]|nr:glycogen/starch/alpha-glucan phosphorylase [Gammaproteobacteria bacterium]QOJ32355.1 MAG: glycogen/starch/alpha-glucan phosphorylase [Gammaproteobacteria bacterium]